MDDRSLWRPAAALAKQRGSARMARTKRTTTLTDDTLITLGTGGRTEATWWHEPDPNLGLRVQAKGTRTWVMAPIQPTGTEARSRTAKRPIVLGPLALFPTVRAALRAFHERQNGDALAPAVTVRVAMERLLADRAPHWKPGTIRQMKTAQQKVVSAFGNDDLGSLRASSVAAWFDGIQDRPHAADYALTALSMTYAHAGQLGLVPPQSNPCRGLRRRRKAPHIDVLDRKGFVRLFAALDDLEGDGSVPSPVCEAVRLIALTGARRSEIERLRWCEWDGDRLRLEDSKTGARTIYLSAPAVRVLSRQRGRTLSSDDRRWVFSRGYRGNALKVSAEEWDLIRRAIGMPGMRMHDLRHSYASLAVNQGADLKTLGALLGHRDLSTTARYAKPDRASIRKAAQKTERMILERARSGTAGLTS